ncbi:MAG TPA: hypothetical protein VFZ25_14720 [Chloroflexota bacterium]|nr:hypothetical protein [Chloroflexota bacterium]
MRESPRRRHYRYASAPSEFVNLLLFVLLFALMVGVAYYTMHHSLVSQLGANLLGEFKIR